MNEIRAARIMDAIIRKNMDDIRARIIDVIELLIFLDTLGISENRQEVEQIIHRLSEADVRALLRISQQFTEAAKTWPGRWGIRPGE